MHRLEAYVFDHHDDTDGRVLRSLITDPTGIPSFVKEAHRLSRDEIRAYPDDLFALVIVDDNHKFKKYAMHDKGNTTLSVAYLLKCAHLLPRDAVKIAAQNLVYACQRFDIDIPDHLKLAAKTGVSGISGKGQKPYAKGAVVKQFHVKEPGSQFVENPRLGNVEPVTPDDKERFNYHSVPGTNFQEIPIMGQKEKREPMPENGKEKKAHSFELDSYIQRAKQRNSIETNEAFLRNFSGGGDGQVGRAKQTREYDSQGQRVSPYVSMPGWDPASMVEEDKAPPSETLLDGKYPVDTYEQVKMASAYFNENWRAFHPRDRHQYCVKLASRMRQLLIDVPENIDRYGSTTYSADMESYLMSRRPLVDADFLPALDTLLEKSASVSPQNFVEAVDEFDRMSGLIHWWDASVPDPWRTTFGPSVEKVASAGWTYDKGGTRIGVEELEELALNGKHALKVQFGPAFVEEFAKKPKAVFESMPDPQKLVLARLASDRHAGTFSC